MVEDDQDLLSFYSRYLKRVGYDSVLTVASGEELVKAVAQGWISPDVALLNYRLLGMDGFETAKEILALRPEIKVIITTADDSIGPQANSMGMGFLLKPFSLSKLLEAMNRA